MTADRTRLPQPGPNPPFHFPAIARTRLPNGLSVWTAEHRALPVVAFILLLRGGAAADPPERPGLAAFTADMLDEGTGDRNAIDVHEAIARIGAQFDTEIGPDAAQLSLTTLSRFRARGLGLLADMVGRPRLAEPDCERVRQLRLNRLVQLRDLPPAVADRAFARLLYGSHPYGHMPIGTEASLKAIAHDEVVGFHRERFVPSRATLVAVGDASHDRLLAEAADAFAGWAGSPSDTSGADVDAVPTSPASRVAIVDRPGATQTEIRIGHVSVPRATSDYHALLVLNMILGGQFVSRINLNLREDKGYTYSARTAFDARRGPGPFLLQVSVQAAVTAAAVREALAEFEAIRDGRPASASELEVGTAALTRGFARGFETSEQVARAASQLALYDLPDDYFEQFVPRVSAVTTAEVTRVARQHLHPSRMTVLVVGDRDAAGPALAGLGLGEPFPAETV